MANKNIFIRLVKYFDLHRSIFRRGKMSKKRDILEDSGDDSEHDDDNGFKVNEDYAKK